MPEIPPPPENAAKPSASPLGFKVTTTSTPGHIPNALGALGGGLVGDAIAAITGGGEKRQAARLELRKPPDDPTSKHAGASLGQDILFQFNPESLSISRKAKWAPSKQPNSNSGGPTQYQGSEPTSLSLTMLFDCSDTLDDSVVKSVENVFAACVPVSESQDKKKPSPPWIIFRWGNLESFPAIMTSVDVSFELFTSTGTPIRASCKVTLQETSGVLKSGNPSSGSVYSRNSHMVVAGDTYASVATAQYGNPQYWRALAERNDCDDPMAINVGSTWVCPAIEELA